MLVNKVLYWYHSANIQNQRFNALHTQRGQLAQVDFNNSASDKMR